MQNILGQSRAIDALQANLQSGRLHHAYIFHGPKGVGKFTTARAFAKLLLCPAPSANLTGQIEACGQCDACRMMQVAGSTDDKDTADNPFDTETHPDYHVIRKELAGVSSVASLRTRKQMNIPIDLLRELMIGGKTSDDHFHDAAAFKTAQLGHNKVFIIDEAELLASNQNESQNALLKTLEEPSAGTYLILVTSSEDRLLPTIRSRCQRVSFAPLPDALVEQWLDDHADKLSVKQRDWLVQFAAGSLGRVQLALDYDLYDWAKAILPALNDMRKDRFPAVLGGVMAGQINQFAETWVDRHKNASKDAANKLAATLMWTLLTQCARGRIAAISAKCHADDPLAAQARLDPWLGLIEAVGEAEQALGSNVNIGLVTDALVARMHDYLSPVGAT